MNQTAPNPSNATIEEVFTAMHASPTKKGFIRLQAIYFLLQNHDKEFVAKAALTCVRTLNRWVSAFNESGIDGLIEEPRSGRPSLIKPEVKDQIIELLDDPAKANREHWTLTTLHGYLSEKISLDCSYSTLVRAVHQEDYVYRFPRPQSVEQDEELRSNYLESLKIWEQDYDHIWYIDEVGFEGDPRPRRRWVKKGEKRTVPYAGIHLRETVIGGVCSKTGEFLALQVTRCNADVFQVFLDHMAKEIKNKNCLLIMDNASWHKAKSLNWHDMDHEYLPPYSPDFNPIERLWMRMKAEYFTDWIAKKKEDLTRRVTTAILAFMKRNSDVKSIC